jgi:hypothetical protein
VPQLACDPPEITQNSLGLADAHRYGAHDLHENMLTKPCPWDTAAPRRRGQAGDDSAAAAAAHAPEAEGPQPPRRGSRGDSVPEPRACVDMKMRNPTA